MRRWNEEVNLEEKLKERERERERQRHWVGLGRRTEKRWWR
jgi:hypothetical protein